MLFQNTENQLHNQADIVLRADKVETVEHLKFLSTLSVSNHSYNLAC